MASICIILRSDSKVNLHRIGYRHPHQLRSITFLRCAESRSVVGSHEEFRLWVVSTEHWRQFPTVAWQEGHLGPGFCREAGAMTRRARHEGVHRFATMHRETQRTPAAAPAAQIRCRGFVARCTPNPTPQIAPQTGANADHSSSLRWSSPW